jgi:sugar (pentulose or hexulose) kinase
MLLLWMKQCKPDAFARVRWVLHCKDWLNLCLTGKVITDGSDASTSLLNVRTTRYEHGLLDLLGLNGSAACFPPVGKAGDTVGQVTPDAARQSGLPQGLAVILGGIDVAVMAAGAGVITPGEAMTIIGTTLCNQVVMSEAQVDHRDPRGSILQHVVPDAFLRLMATSSGTSSIDWARQTVAPGLSFAELEAGIAAIPLGSEGVMFQPYLYGERAPFRDPAATAGFYGLSARHTPLHMMRAVYEGLAFSFAECYQALPPVSSVTVTGGGANSNALCQMMADNLGKPVRRTGIPELGIYGGFAVLRSSLGLKNAAPEFSREFLPDEKRHQRYVKLFDLFTGLRKSMQAYWSSRQEIFRSE